MTEEFNTWKHHFIQQARGLIPHEKHFYKVSSQKGKGDSTNIKLVTPTQQIVERAKSTLNHQPIQPPSIYDPVTGTMQREEGKYNKLVSSRKRKALKKPTKGVKKRKIIKKKAKSNIKRTMKNKVRRKKKMSKKKQKTKRGWWK